MSRYGLLCSLPSDTVEKSIPYGFKHGLDEPSA